MIQQYVSPLIIALIVNSTKLVGTTTDASNDFIALFKNLKIEQYKSVTNHGRLDYS